MLYTTLNINRARQADILIQQDQFEIRLILLDELFRVVGGLLSTFVMQMKTQRQYGTVLHAD